MPDGFKPRGSLAHPIKPGAAERAAPRLRSPEQHGGWSPSTDVSRPRQGTSPQPAAVASRIRAGSLRGGKASSRGAHPAVHAVGVCDRAARRASQPGHARRGGQDRRRHWGAPQRNAWEPDRTRNRTHRVARRRPHARQGVYRRCDRYEHALHAGHVAAARRAQAPRATVQSCDRENSRPLFFFWAPSPC